MKSTAEMGQNVELFLNYFKNYTLMKQPINSLLEKNISLLNSTANSEQQVDIDSFTCPITQDLMNDPVTTADGFTYEREAIECWLLNNQTSPCTNLPLAHKDLVPNDGLRKLIDEYKNSLTDQVSNINATSPKEMSLQELLSRSEYEEILSIQAQLDEDYELALELQNQMELTNTEPTLGLYSPEPKFEPKIEQKTSANVTNDEIQDFDYAFSLQEQEILLYNNTDEKNENEIKDEKIVYGLHEQLRFMYFGERQKSQWANQVNHDFEMINYTNNTSYSNS